MFVYISMLAYTALLAFLFLYFPEKQRRLKIFLFPLGIIYFLIMAFRKVGVGTDTLSYVPIFEANNLSVTTLTKMFSMRFEPGYIWLNQFIRLFTDKYTWLFIAYALPIVGIWFFVLNKYSKNVYLSILFYLLGGFYTFAMSGIRNALAVAITLLAFHLFLRKKVIWSLILTIVAMFFHTSAIIFFIFYPLSRLKVTKHFILIGSVAVLITYPFIHQLVTLLLVFFPKYQSYLESTYLTAGFKVSGILEMIMFILVFLLGEWFLRNQTNETRIDSMIRILFVLATFCVILNSRTALLTRFSIYFKPYATLYIPYFLSKIKDKKAQTLCLYGLLVAYSLYFFIPLIWRPEWLEVVPYKTVFTDWLFGY